MHPRHRRHLVTKCVRSWRITHRKNKMSVLRNRSLSPTSRTQEQRCDLPAHSETRSPVHCLRFWKSEIKSALVHKLVKSYMSPPPFCAMPLYLTYINDGLMDFATSWNNNERQVKSIRNNMLTLNDTVPAVSVHLQRPKLNAGHVVFPWRLASDIGSVLPCLLSAATPDPPVSSPASWASAGQRDAPPAEPPQPRDAPPAETTAEGRSDRVQLTAFIQPLV